MKWSKKVRRSKALTKFGKALARGKTIPQAVKIARRSRMTRR